MQAGVHRLALINQKSYNMDSANVIRSLEYSFLGQRTANGSQLRVVQLKIDFEAAKFYFRGNWEFVSSRHFTAVSEHSTPHPENMHFQMNIFPSSPINLQDESNDGLILFLKGPVNDKRVPTPSTGMVVFTRNTAATEIKNSWNVLCYLYESEDNYLEIKFKLPVFLKASSLPAILGNIN